MIATRSTMTSGQCHPQSLWMVMTCICHLWTIVVISHIMDGTLMSPLAHIITGSLSQAPLGSDRSSHPTSMTTLTTSALKSPAPLDKGIRSTLTCLGHLPWTTFAWPSLQSNFSSSTPKLPLPLPSRKLWTITSPQTSPWVSTSTNSTRTLSMCSRPLSGCSSTGVALLRRRYGSIVRLGEC